MKNKRKKVKINNENKEAPKKKFRVNWLIIFALICVAIPSSALGYILLTAWLETGTPQITGRFDDDFPYRLVAENLKTIENEISTISGVEKVTVSMQVATLRIYVDTSDSLDKNKIEEIAVQTYEKVDALFPVSDFFTKHEKQAQYDLEIYACNNIEFTDDFIYIRLVKNAVAEKLNIQNVGEAIDPALVERLRSKEDIKDNGTTGEEANEDSGDEETEDD